MKKAPDFRNVKNSFFRRVLSAGNTTPDEFLKCSAEQQAVVWDSCWEVWCENRAYERREATSASAKLENEAKKESLNQPEFRQFHAGHSPVKSSFEPDIDDLWASWLEKKSNGQSDHLSPLEQIWPNLPARLLEELKRRIEDYEKKLRPFLSWESSGSDSDYFESQSYGDDNREIIKHLEVGFVPPGTYWKLQKRLDDNTSAFGAVWLAQHELTHSYGVCKFCKQLSPRNLASLEQEARLVSRLEHPGIARLREVHLRNSETPFIVFEYANGNDFAKTLYEVFQGSTENSEKVLKQRKRIFVLVHREMEKLPFRLSYS